MSSCVRPGRVRSEWIGRLAPDQWLPTHTTRSDCGAATLLAVATIVLIVMFGAVSVGLGELAAGHAAASSAADLAALAGASRIAAGSAAACDAAEKAAIRNGARLTACELRGWDVDVVVRRPAPRIVRLSARLAGKSAPALLATARAGQGDAILSRPP